MNNLVFIFLSLAALAGFSGHESTELISEELVPVIFKRGSIICLDKSEGDGGFMGPEPGRLTMVRGALFDRTLRVTEYYFSYALPDAVPCSQLWESIKNVPESLSIKRRVSRVISLSSVKKKEYSLLVSELSLELPINVAGNNVVMTDSSYWLEEPLYTPGHFPKESTYTAHTHPQSASAPVGLFCAPLYQGAKQHSLGFGYFNGSPDRSSNLDVVTTSPFDNEKQCQEKRSELLKKFEAEDPGNWGSLIPVKREIAPRFRFILDNQAQGMCQEIMLERIEAYVEELKFSAVGASFPLRTVDIELCSQVSAKL